MPLTISLAFLLSACAGNETKPVPDVQIVTKYISFDCGYSPDIDFVQFTSPTWRVIDGKFTLTTDEYAKLGENMTQIIKVTKQLLLKIDYYEECLESAEHFAGEENGN
jgi:hypothetical protein